MAEIPAGSTHSGAVSGCSRGAQAERVARRRLEQADLRFVAANMQVRGGEIDLIMREGITWVFVAKSATVAATPLAPPPKA